jgi:uncharacterized protein YprB with RNaseH-like and TPR domain
VSLRDKLDLLGQSAAPAAPVPTELQQFVETSPVAEKLARALGATEHENERGRFCLRAQRLPDHLSHGPRPLAHARSLPLTLLAKSQAGLEDFDPETALYLDTETTGLSGGSGTYAFLVGLGWFERGELVLEQLFMRDHSEEKAVLAHLEARLRRCSGLVTFNGRSFDAPLLQTRFTMNRMRSSLEEMPHLDLLYISRRLWSGILENCKLETIECQLLGQARHGDVPGWLVPQLYFRFLQTSEARGMRSVIEHNRRDILTMVGLVGSLRHYLEDPFDHSASLFRCPKRRAMEQASFGRWLLHLRQFEAARKMLDEAFAVLAPGPHFRQAGLLLARLCSRAGQSSEAVAIWRRLLEADPRDTQVHEELAKVFEHRERDYPRALDHVGRALAQKDLKTAWRKRLLHRESRLSRLRAENR